MFSYICLWFQNIRKREGIDIVDPFEPDIRRELLTEKFTILVGYFIKFQTYLF